jgi:IMP dehydrogenase
MAKYVRDVMTKRLVTANLSDSVADARRLMKDNRIHSILIPPTRSGMSWWIFTETDLLLALQSGEDPSNISIGDYASPVKYKARQEWDYHRTLEEMINAGVKHLPVVDDNGDVVGMISSSNMVDDF